MLCVASVGFGSTAAAADFSCPKYRHGVRLSNYDVFNGNPSHLADMQGDGSGWNLSSPSSFKGETYHLVCTYLHDTLDLAIPATVKHCEAKGTLLNPAVACQ